MLDAKHGLTVLTRLAARRPDQRNRIAQALFGRLTTLAPVAVNVAVETGDPIGAVLAELLDTHVYDEVLQSIEVIVPFQTTSLRELALVVVRKRYEAEVYQKPLETRQQVLKAAQLMQAYAYRLEMIGKLTPAAATLGHAISLVHQIPDPDAGVMRLAAQMLHNLAGLYSDLHQLESSEGAATAAVSLHRQTLSEGAGDPLDFASSLNTLAIAQMMQQKSEDAKRTFTAAIEALQQHGDPAAERTRAELARYRNNLGALVTRLDDAVTARDLMADSVQQIRRLCEAKPDAYRPYLARYLLSQSRTLLSLGEHEEARRDCEEGLALWAGLAEGRPDAFTDDYLKALMLQSEIDASEGSSERFREAARASLSRVSAEPERVEHWRAAVLRHEVSSLATEADHAKTEARTAELVQTERALANPHEPNRVAIAQALAYHSLSLRRLGRLDDAIADADEALATLGDSSDPQSAWARGMVLQFLGGHLIDSERPADARSAYDGAIKAFRLAADPASMARVVLTAWDSLQDGSERKKAIAFLQHATAELASDKATAGELASVWARLALSSAQQGKPAGAARAADKAMESLSLMPGQPGAAHVDVHDWLSRAAAQLLPEPSSEERMLGLGAGRRRASVSEQQLAKIDDAALRCLGERPHLESDEISERYFTSLNARASHSIAAGDAAQAVQVRREMVAKQRERLASRPGTSVRGLAACLDLLALALKKNGQTQEALAQYTEAITVHETAYSQDPWDAGYDYAVALNNYSNRLWDVKRGRESIDAVVKAIAILKTGVHGAPADLKYLLGNLAGSYITRTHSEGIQPDPKVTRAVLGLG